MGRDAAAAIVALCYIPLGLRFESERPMSSPEQSPNEPAAVEPQPATPALGPSPDKPPKSGHLHHHFVSALVDDLPAQHAAFRAFNRWLHEDWSFNFRDRLFAAPAGAFALAEPGDLVWGRCARVRGQRSSGERPDPARPREPPLERVQVHARRGLDHRTL